MENYGFLIVGKYSDVEFAKVRIKSISFAGGEGSRDPEYFEHAML